MLSHTRVSPVLLSDLHRHYSGLALNSCMHSSLTPTHAPLILRQRLRCRVMDLGPLSACVGLRELRCMHSFVSSLAPLSGCAALRELHCNDTMAQDLLPLAQCTQLQVGGHTNR